VPDPDPGVHENAGPVVLGRRIENESIGQTEAGDVACSRD